MKREFQVQEITSWGMLWGAPLGSFAIIDSAIWSATDLSKENKGNIYVVRDMGNLGKEPRGVAIRGKWQWSTSCKRCAGSHSRECSSCLGSGQRVRL